MDNSNTTSVKPLPSNRLLHQRRSFRDIQSVISKMNPEVLKSVIASVELNSKSGKSYENRDALASKTPVSDLSTLGGNTSGFESTIETSPLTIFYNGTVAVFDVPQHRAENIFKFAVSSNDQSQLLNLPIARRKSLQRFMEKRKERINLALPYGCRTGI